MDVHISSYMFFCSMNRRHPSTTRTDTFFPYTTLFRSLARLSGDLARTQAEHAGAIATASRLAVRTELANGLSPALDTLRDGMAGLSASVTATTGDMMPGLDRLRAGVDAAGRSEEQTSELQSLLRLSYAVFCLKKKTHIRLPQNHDNHEDRYRLHKQT